LAYIPQAAIALELGVSTATVSNDLKAIRELWLAEARVDIQSAAVRELQSLDRLESRLWQQFASTKISPDERTRTASQILRCKQRRAKMLGFDQPDLLEVRITSQQVQDEIARLRTKHTERGPHALPAG
jgi:predicted transcriptional regulator